MRAESTYTKLHKMCLWGLWNYSLQAAENTIIPILISQLKKLHRVGIYTASNLSYSDPLHAVGDCKKCSETAVGNVTQWIPVIFESNYLQCTSGFFYPECRKLPVLYFDDFQLGNEVDKYVRLLKTCAKTIIR